MVVPTDIDTLEDHLSQTYNNSAIASQRSHGNLDETPEETKDEGRDVLEVGYPRDVGLAWDAVYDRIDWTPGIPFLD